MIFNIIKHISCNEFHPKLILVLFITSKTYHLDIFLNIITNQNILVVSLLADQTHNNPNTESGPIPTNNIYN